MQRSIEETRRAAMARCEGQVYDAMAEEKLIGELLTEHGVITRAQLEEALVLQRSRDGKICQILMSLGYLTESALLRCLAQAAETHGVSVQPYVIDPGLMAHVPKAFAIEHEVIPLDQVGDYLTLGIAGASDTSTPAALHEHTGFFVRDILCSRPAVKAAITQYYGPTGAAATAPSEAGSLVVPHPLAVRREAGGPDEALPGPESVRLRNMLIVIESIDQFPLLPEVHMRVLERLGDPDVEMGEVAPLIEQDPTLTANVLKLANSAAYAARDGFTSVERAIIYLGLRQVHSTVFACAVLQQLNAAGQGDLTQLFLESQRCGLLTKIISDSAKFGDPDAAFTAGLLADIGRIALRLFSQEYAELIQYAQRSSAERSAHVQRRHSRVEAEEAVLGVSASELGYHLAQHWGLPETLANTIRFHDRLDRVAAPPPLTVAVALAQYCLRNEAEDGGFGEPDSDPELAWLIAAMGRESDILAPIEARYRASVEHLTTLSFGQA